MSLKASPKPSPAAFSAWAAVDTALPTQPSALLGSGGEPAAGAAATVAAPEFVVIAGAAGAAAAGAATAGAAELEPMGMAGEAVLETAENEAAAAPPIIAPAIAQRMRKRFILQAPLLSD